jgi:3-hydroxyisobutyrate dehydrogenase/2-hydroxy-3-oxopropionate reductase
MAHNLYAAGFPLTVFNRSPGRAGAIAARGARVAASLAELAADADVIVSMVADDEAAEAVHAGLRETARPGTVILEMSTLGVPCVLRLGEHAARRGVAVVDAPVSGSIPAATSGQLVALVGGDPASIERALPVLAVLTRTQHLLGPRGSGSSMKLVLNAMLAVTNQALGEALLLAEGAGLDPEAAYDAIADSAIASPFVDYKRQAFLDPESAPLSFTIELLLKDVELARALALEAGVETPMTAGAREALIQAIAAGEDGADIARVAASRRPAHVTETS